MPAKKENILIISLTILIILICLRLVTPLNERRVFLIIRLIFFIADSQL